VRDAGLRRWRLAVLCSDGFGFVAFRYGAGTRLSRTMKFSVLIGAASEHHFARGTWISRSGPGAATAKAEKKR
jgi:hypothetical protein